LADVLQRLDAAADAAQRQLDDERAAVKHFLAVLAGRHPGKSVEVRIPPYAAVQCVEGARHTRGTPPAVVEMDARTWLEIARGRIAFVDARAAGRIRASGERSDLTPLLPLT
jgi:Bacterial SCP ortholog